MRLFPRIAILLVPFTLFLVLFFIDLQIDGERRARIRLGEESPFIGSLSPAERIEGWNVIDEPVYFTIRPPSSEYETVTVRITFDPNDTPLIELGPLADPFSRAFDLRPLYNKTLEALTWPREVYANGLRYFTRDGELLENAENLALYHAENPTPFRIASYRARSTVQTVTTSLRSSHRAVVYVKNEPLAIDFLFTDVNRTTGEDPLTLRVLNERDEVVYETTLVDDGNKGKDQEFTRRPLSLRIDDLPEGPYRVEWTTTSDLFLREWTTTLSKFVFQNSVSLGDQVGWRDEELTQMLVTDGKNFSAETLHVEGVQTIRVGSSVLDLRAPHVLAYLTTTESGILSVTVPRGDVRLTVDGMIAFSPDAFFDPEGIILSGSTDLASREIDAILTSYQPVVQEDGLMVAEQTFVIAPYLDAGGVMTFALSAPYLSIENRTFTVEQIEVVFNKPPLRGKELFRAIRNRLPFGL